MEKLTEQIKKAAEIRLMELDITEYMKDLEQQYGVVVVKQAVERSGLKSVMDHMYM